MGFFILESSPVSQERRSSKHAKESKMKNVREEHETLRAAQSMINLSKEPFGWKSFFTTRIWHEGRERRGDLGFVVTVVKLTFKTAKFRVSLHEVCLTKLKVTQAWPNQSLAEIFCLILDLSHDLAKLTLVLLIISKSLKERPSWHCLNLSASSPKNPSPFGLVTQPSSNLGQQSRLLFQCRFLNLPAQKNELHGY